MLFGVRLANEVYSPWKDAYIQYERLKKLLKENVVPSSGTVWSEDDETSFVSVLDSELEKVYSFQTKTYESLSNRLDTLEKSINENSSITPEEGKGIEADVEEILEEAQQLDRFSRLNFTGFLKIVKKHDRLHPKYQVKPLLQVRLSNLPFHSEDYSPLLYRISVIYSFLSENFGAGQSGSASASAKLLFNSVNSDYTTFKFWVHPDNVMEVKTRILRHLPLLVYGSKTNVGTGDNQAKRDPTITSLYFDSPKFELYESKLQKNDISPSLRLRWSGKLSDKPEITLEKKVIDHSTTGEFIPDQRIDIKEKYIKPFLSGEYHMEKTVQKMKDRGTPQADVEAYEKDVKDLQEFVSEHELQPVVRTVYTRSAFQIPGDNRVRAILDSDIVFIREDSFDHDRPIRDPESWHRSDIDADGLENPLSLLRKGEFSKFPFAVLEFRVLTKSSPVAFAPGTSAAALSSSISGSAPTSSISAIKRHGKWIAELTNSHLVKEVPKFSKFVQGIASLFAEDDRLDLLPFWLHMLEHDIRQDPKQAWEEQRRRIQESQQASQESNKIRARTSRLSLAAADAASLPSSSGATPLSAPAEIPEEAIEEEGDDEDDDDDESDSEDDDSPAETLLNKKSKRARGRKLLQSLTFLQGSGPRLDADSEDEEVFLPPGVVKPDVLIRQSGPVKVETKVWLANERTFNRWLHVATLFSALTFTLYSTVDKASDEGAATVVAYILFGLTIFSALWGYWTYLNRLKHIRARSELHLDNPVGPLVIAIGLLAALIINFISTYNSKVWNPKHPHIQPEPIINNTTPY